MSIKAYNSDVPLSIGQWVCFDGIVMNAFASRPAVIRKLTKSSIVCEVPHFLENTNVIEWESMVKRKSNITFVADTKEEADAMAQASRSHVENVLKRERDLKNELELDRQRIVEKTLLSVNSRIDQASQS